MRASSYTQSNIAGGSVVHTVRKWRSGELGTGRTDKGPRMQARSSLKHLQRIAELRAAGVEAAGSVEAYYNSGGLAGPFGRSMHAGRRKAAPKARPVLAAVPVAAVCEHCGGRMEAAS